MKSPPIVSLYDVPMAELRARIDRARELLQETRSRSRRSGGTNLLATAFEEIERLLPGFLARPTSLLARTLSELAPRERQALRRAIVAERKARQRVAHLLGDVSPAVAEELLARIEAQESLAAELREFMRSFDQPCGAPMLA